MGTDPQEKERFFSVELKSKTSLKGVSINNGQQEGVLIEGTLGQLVQATFAEDLILEIVGEKGTLRINLTKQELKTNTGEVKTCNLLQ
jgi:hypothetical protein